MEIDSNELDNKYMRMALKNGMRSRENFKVGACVVNPNGKVIAMGYNSILFPKLHSESINDINFRYSTINLAIESALNDPHINYKNATVYQTTYPSTHCVKEMVKKGIRRVVFYNDERSDLKANNFYTNTDLFLEHGGITKSFFKAQVEGRVDFTEDIVTKEIRLNANLVNTNIEKYKDYQIRKFG
nr:deoxycytidylate deaminase-like [Onthophagus taurus]